MPEKVLVLSLFCQCLLDLGEPRTGHRHSRHEKNRDEEQHRNRDAIVESKVFVRVYDPAETLKDFGADGNLSLSDSFPCVLDGIAHGIDQCFRRGTISDLFQGITRNG